MSLKEKIVRAAMNNTPPAEIAENLGTSTDYVSKVLSHARKDNREIPRFNTEARRKIKATRAAAMTSSLSKARRRERNRAVRMIVHGWTFEELINNGDLDLDADEVFELYSHYRSYSRGVAVLEGIQQRNLVSSDTLTLAGAAEQLAAAYVTISDSLAREQRENGRLGRELETEREALRESNQREDDLSRKYNQLFHMHELFSKHLRQHGPDRFETLLQRMDEKEKVESQMEAAVQEHGACIVDCARLRRQAEEWRDQTIADTKSECSSIRKWTEGECQQREAETAASQKECERREAEADAKEQQSRERLDEDFRSKKSELYEDFQSKKSELDFTARYLARKFLVGKRFVILSSDRTRGMEKAGAFLLTHPEFLSEVLTASRPQLLYHTLVRTSFDQREVIRAVLDMADAADFFKIFERKDEIDRTVEELVTRSARQHRPAGPPVAKTLYYDVIYEDILIGDSILRDELQRPLQQVSAGVRGEETYVGDQRLYKVAEAFARYWRLHLEPQPEEATREDSRSDSGRGRTSAPTLASLPVS